MEREVFDAFYRRHIDAARRRARRELPFDDANEAVSQAFEVVWRKRSEAPAAQLELDRWFARIMRLCILQERQRFARKHHDSRFVFDLRLPVTELLLADIALAVEGAEHAKNVLGALSEEERHLFHIAFLWDYGVEKGAAELGIRPNAYKTRVSRLRSKLRHLSTVHDEGLHTSL